jgi:NitT/TauT family transport system ATP-binding protein
MSTELLLLWDLTRPAVVFVTHDLEEAIALADKVVVLTAGPATVKAVFPVDLPRPRVVQEVRFQPAFGELYHQIWEALRDEVMVGYARTMAADAAGK